MKDINEMDLWDQPDEGDPLVWIRRHREELSKKYPTIEALCAYYKTVPPVEEISARLKKAVAEKKQKERETAAGKPMISTHETDIHETDYDEMNFWNGIDLRDQPDEGDPLVWIRKHREELSKKYPTVEALFEYYRSVPPLEVISARLDKAIAEKKLQKGREAAATK